MRPELKTSLFITLVLFAAAAKASDKPKEPRPSEVRADGGMATADGWPRPVPPTKAPFTWNVPKILESVPVSGELSSQGIPVRAQAVRSGEKFEPLVRHFLLEFQKADLYIPPPQYQFHVKGGHSLTAIDDERLISYTVIFQPNPDGTTTVLLGEANLGQRRRDPAAGPPLMPSAERVLRSTSEGAATISFEVGAPEQEVFAFYRQAFAELGYREREPMLFAKPGASLQVETRPLGEKRTSVVLIERFSAAAAE